MHPYTSAQYPSEGAQRKYNFLLSLMALKLFTVYLTDIFKATLCGMEELKEKYGVNNTPPETSPMS